MSTDTKAIPTQTFLDREIGRKGLKKTYTWSLLEQATKESSTGELDMYLDHKNLFIRNYVRYLMSEIILVNHDKGTVILCDLSTRHIFSAFVEYYYYQLMQDFRGYEHTLFDFTYELICTASFKGIDQVWEDDIYLMGADMKYVEVYQKDLEKHI